MLGPARELENPRLQGLRSRVIKGFRNYLVFYRVLDDGVEVIRVLHGARDLQAILEAEDADAD